MNDSQSLEEPKALVAVYDLWTSPPTYDFFTFLVEAERYRRTQKYDCIDLAFLPGPNEGFREDGLPPPAEERRGMLHRVCVGGARLLPSVRNVLVLKQRVWLDEQNIFPPDWKNMAPVSCYGVCFQVNGLQCLRATDGARAEVAKRYPGKYATITLRHADYWPARNSNDAAWDDAALWLVGKGIQPVIVPDTHGHSIGKWETCDAAAWDIDLRLALYERALVNAGTTTGPFVLCMLSEMRAPYIMLNVISSDDAPAHKEDFLAAHGLKVGDNYSENGITVWKKDSAENIIEALSQWFEKETVIQ